MPRFVVQTVEFLLPLLNLLLKGTLAIPVTYIGGEIFFFFFL